VLSDEDAANPPGIPYAGSVAWKVEPADPASGQGLAIRAEVNIPGRGLKLMMSFRRNPDPSLPASHTIEMTFSVPSDFADRGIGSVPGLMLKIRREGGRDAAADHHGEDRGRRISQRPVEQRD